MKKKCKENRRINKQPKMHCSSAHTLHLHCESIGMNETKNTNTMEMRSTTNRRIYAFVCSLAVFFSFSFSLCILVHPKDFSYKNKVKLLHSIHLVFENHWSNMIRYKLLLFLIVSIEIVNTQIILFSFDNGADKFCCGWMCLEKRISHSWIRPPLDFVDN